MFKIVADDSGGTVVSLDTHFVLESDWLSVSEGIFTFADTLTVNISTNELVLVSKHIFQPTRIGFHGAEPVEQATVTGTTAEEKIDSLIAALAARGDIIDGTTT